MRRTLGTIERLVWLLSQHHHPINFAMVGSIRGSVTFEQLRSSLDVVQQRHPLLRARISIEPADRACLVSDNVPPIPLQHCLRQDADDWISVVEGELAQPFSWTTGPLLRCIWLDGGHESDFILVCSHIIGDGLSVTNLLREILEQVAMPSSVVPLAELPALEALIPPAAFSQLAELLSADAKPASASTPERVESTAVSPQSSSNLVPTRIVAWSLSPATTSALVARCRREKTTVHAAICAAFLMTYATQQPDAESVIRHLQCPVNLRQRLDRSLGDDFGLFITLVETVARCAPDDDLWAVAREVKRNLAQIIDDERLYLSVVAPTLMTAALSDTEMGAFLQGTPPASYDLSVTNLGRIDIPCHYGALQLDGIYGPILNTSNYETVLGINTFAGDLSCTFASGDSDRAQAICEQAMHYLAEAVGTAVPSPLQGQLEA